MQHNPDWYNVAFKIFLKNDKGEILALKNPATHNPPDGGWHDLPGGRINEDEFETPYEKIVKRELEEELGTAVKYEINWRPVAFARHRYFSRRQDKEIRILFICLEGKYLGGEIKISDEHVGYKWIDIRKIKLEDYFMKGPLEAVRRYLQYLAS